ncbi:NAD(P)/FAD-dependent oxidoreductase [Oricola sp.]|uniref:NAD(P)/FAD-dependent oxidoreductase n=1 Tax=Oricola sp. TaxID=1979950 RepID=UPI0025E65F82|nr:NAD(P)/FAD-dependent oxidoreductase [Oricola sp.]MCI5075897.1 NAD(P)/FAD-dependent oxidoreductase [Oricola sp.]
MPYAKPFAPHYTAIVVGARCAGAATAMLLARQGARVLMIDRDRRGTDTLSTHALMRGAVMQLSSWGLLDKVIDAGTPAIRKTSFIYGDEAVDLDIQPSHGVDALYAPRRYVLDSILADAAEAAGVDTRFEMSLRGLLTGADGRVRGAVIDTGDGETVPVSADIVIGADGKQSSVARFAGAEVQRRAQHATAVVYGYFDGIPDHGNRWYFTPGYAAGAIPTNNGQTCVFVSMPRLTYLEQIRGRLEAGLRGLADDVFPDLAARLAPAKLDRRPIGFVGHHGHLRRAAGPGWALVGDAGYFKDQSTAHGITDALRDAEILARAVASGPSGLARYQETRDALSRGMFDVTERIASLDWSMDEVKRLHFRLNKVMKDEQDWMAASFAAEPRAA